LVTVLEQLTEKHPDNELGKRADYMLKYYKNQVATKKAADGTKSTE
jgi:hypothetical protein